MTPLLAIDGHHLLYRSWWGFSDRRILSRDRKRDLTGIFGFLAILRKTHLEVAADHEIVVAFDGENAAVGRQSIDAGYKANRADADHTAIKSLKPIKEALTATGVRWIELDDFEGDDVIATLTRHATSEGRAVTCYSGDKDLFQLLEHPAISLITPARRHLTSDDIITRYQVTPAQWPDYRALIGDASDNIPGVPGIGPKTAATLLADGFMLDHLPGSTRLQIPRCHVVTTYWERLLRWREMIRLNRNVPLPRDDVRPGPTLPMPRAAEILSSLDLW